MNYFKMKVGDALLLPEVTEKVEKIKAFYSKHDHHACLLWLGNLLSDVIYRPDFTSPENPLGPKGIHRIMRGMSLMVGLSMLRRNDHWDDMLDAPLHKILDEEEEIIEWGHNIDDILLEFKDHTMRQLFDSVWDQIKDKYQPSFLGDGKNWFSLADTFDLLLDLIRQFYKH